MTEFIAATGILQAFSLITFERGQTDYKMHHLVQLAMEQWLRVEGLIIPIQREALQSVEKAYPWGEYESWQTCELLYPHAQIVAQYDLQDHSSQLTRADLLFKLAQYQYERGKVEQAGQYIRLTLAIQDELLGQDDIKTVRSRSFLGKLYRRAGEFKLAHRNLREALTRLETLVGPDNLDALTTKMLLAISYEKTSCRKQKRCIAR